MKKKKTITLYTTTNDLSNHQPLEIPWTSALSFVLVFCMMDLNYLYRFRILNTFVMKTIIALIYF